MRLVFALPTLRSLSRRLITASSLAIDTSRTCYYSSSLNTMQMSGISNGSLLVIDKTMLLLPPHWMYCLLSLRSLSLLPNYPPPTSLTIRTSTHLAVLQPTLHVYSLVPRPPGELVSRPSGPVLGFLGLAGMHVAMHERLLQRGSRLVS